MISALLDLSRLERGEVQRELRRWDLEEVLQEIVEVQRGAAADREIDLRLQTHGPVRVTADRRELDEIFNNVISNAIRYNEDRGWVPDRPNGFCDRD